MTTSPRPGSPLRLTDAEISWFISATRGAVMVEAAMDGCVPCRLLQPVVQKLAAEFADRLAAVTLAPDAEQFHRAHRIDRFPQLLFFRDGRCVGRVMGFDGADKVRDAVARFLGIATGDPSPAELAFRAACA